MLYSREELEKLKSRWEKPLLDPVRKTPIEVDGCKTYRELLRRGLNEIRNVIESQRDVRFKSQHVDSVLGIGWGKKRNLQVKEKLFSLLRTLQLYSLDDFLEKGDPGTYFPHSMVIDLRGADCGGAHFEGVDCYGAHFEGADCRGAHFEGADCRDSHFEEADCSLIVIEFEKGKAYSVSDGETYSSTRLEWADCFGSYFEEGDCNLSDKAYLDTNFEGAACCYAHFEGANCDHADFKGANCYMAHFEGADCTTAHFEGADCMRAHFEKANCYLAHFERANCSEVHFEEADCLEAYFEGANCANAHFERADCMRAHFEEADCLKAHFEGANCDNAHFERTNCMRAHFERANCSEVHFEEADCLEAYFEGANCANAHFEGTNCEGGVFRLANAPGANFSAARLKSSDIRGMNVFGNTHFGKPGEQVNAEKEKENTDMWHFAADANLRIKHCWRECGYYQKADEYQFREMECRRRAKPRFQSWADWFFYYLIAGYGLKISHPLSTMAIIIISYSLFFMACFAAKGDNIFFRIIGKGFYYSIISFTTLGLGEVQLASGALINFLICGEALLGTMLMPLFIVAYARRILQG